MLFVLVFGGGMVAFAIKSLEGSKSVAPASKQLARAIAANDPAAAPGDIGDYVTGVRRYFGRVKSVRHLGTHTERHGSGNQATTNPVSEILVRGRRGAGGLELEFGRTGPFEDYTINDVAELEPDDVRSDLDDRSERAVTRGFRRRGGEVARGRVLDGTFTR